MTLCTHNNDVSVLVLRQFIRHHFVFGSVRAWRVRHLEHKLFQSLVRPALSAQSARACVDAAQTVAVRPIIGQALDCARTVLVPFERLIHVTPPDRKSTRLNSSHVASSYAV